MKKHGMWLLCALALPTMAALGFYAGRQTAPVMTVKLDNPRVTVTESLMSEGARRETHTRLTDQVLVFLDEAQYEVIEAGGKSTMRRRKTGDIVWHNKGEIAPTLVNKGKPYRNLIIALK